MLEELDLELAATRDKSLEIVKIVPRTILTSKGLITFRRRYYYDTNNDTYLYLLDNILEIPKYSRLSKELKIKILSSLNHLSYKDAGIDNLPKGNEISTVYVFNHLNKSTTNVEYISFNTANKTIHVQIDEKYISMKSKRKKHQIEDYIQLVYLLILINQRKKHILVNRTIISARSLNKLFQRINATLVKLYCVEINDKIYISGDLAPYIQNSPERITVCNAIYIPDKFHIQRLVKKYIGQKIEIFNISKFDSHIEAYIDTLDNYPYDKNDNDYHTLLNLLKKTSFIKNWYNDDYLGCCQECINSHYFADRLDKKPNTFTTASLDKLCDLVNSIQNKFPFNFDIHESYCDVSIKCYLPNYNYMIEVKSEYLIDYSNYSYGVRKTLKAISGL